MQGLKIPSNRQLFHRIIESHARSREARPDGRNGGVDSDIPTWCNPDGDGRVWRPRGSFPSRAPRMGEVQHLRPVRPSGFVATSRSGTLLPSSDFERLRLSAVPSVRLVAEQRPLFDVHLADRSISRDRDAGCPSPPAKIRARPPRHPAPPSRCVSLRMDGKTLIRPKAADFKLGPATGCQLGNRGQAERSLCDLRLMTAIHSRSKRMAKRAGSRQPTPASSSSRSGRSRTMRMPARAGRGSRMMAYHARRAAGQRPRPVSDRCRGVSRRSSRRRRPGFRGSTPPRLPAGRACSRTSRRSTR